MDDDQKTDVTPEQEPKPSYTPASKGKRIAAWVGIAAMVFLVLMYSYSIATGAIMWW